MKHVVYGSIMFLCTLIIVLILSMANTNTIKLQELHRIANISVNNLGVYLLRDSIEGDFNYEEVKDLIAVDIQGISSTGDVSASILVCDEINKVIKVRYVFSWTQVNDAIKTYEVTRTVMLDEYI